jgi:hypothetical protein
MMTIRTAATWMVAASLLLTHGCGSGSGGSVSGDSAALVLQIEDDDLVDGTTGVPPLRTLTDTTLISVSGSVSGTDGRHLPARCCVKFATDDPAFHDRHEIVLSGFQPNQPFRAGDVDVDVRGFVGAVAPDFAGPSEKCAVKQPIDLGTECDAPDQCVDPIVSPDGPAAATLVAGEATTVVVLESSRSFVVGTPECNGTVGTPFNLILTVAQFVPEPEPSASPRCTCEHGVLKCNGPDASMTVELRQTPGTATGPCVPVIVLSGAAAQVFSTAPTSSQPDPLVSTPIVEVSGRCCRDQPGCAGTGNDNESDNSCCTNEPTVEEFSRPRLVQTGLKIDVPVSALDAGCAQFSVVTNGLVNDKTTIIHPFHVTTPTPSPTSTPTPTPTPSPVPVATSTGSGDGGPIF